MTTTTNAPATALTAESFKLDLGCFEYNGKAVKVTNKITGFGSGKKTVYTGTIDGTAFENWDVCRIKKALGIAVTGTAKVAAARAAKAEAERVAAEKAAEKAAKEALKEAKAADKVRAAKVAQASNLQKQMMDAVLAGDFAKLAELQKLAAEEAA